MTAWRVARGFQVNVDGTVYSQGDRIADRLDEATVERWRSAGWIEPATDKPRPARAKKTA